jgi:pSer/pThr/pTyr-binding forkhead associated (FHA) protein
MNGADPGAVEVFVFKDGRFLGSRCYSQATVVVGRGRAATLKLNDPSISERHAVIRVEGMTVTIADGGGPGGVLVNGERVNVCKVSSLDEIALGPFRLKVGLLGQEDEDPGFGTNPGLNVEEEHFAEDGDAATVVRKVEEMPEFQQLGQQQPEPAFEARQEYQQMEEATLPRIRKPPSRPPAAFDEVQSHAAASSRSRREQPGFAARDAYGAPAAPAGGYEEMPTRAETPASRKGPGEGFEDFSKPAPREPARAPVRARPEPAEEIAQEPYPEYDGRDTLEEPDGAPMPAAAAVGADLDDEDEEAFVEQFSLLENVVRERFKSKTQMEPYRTVEVIHYEGSEICDLLRADPGNRIRVGVDDFNLATLERGGRASVYFQRDFKGTLVSKGKARPLKAFCNEKFQADKRGKVFAVSLTEGDYAQMIRGSAGYLIRFVRPPTQPLVPFNFGKWALGLMGGALGLQIFIGSAAFHFLLLVLMGFMAPEADLTVVTDAERFAKVALKDLKLEKPKEEPEPEPKEEIKPPPVKDLPKIPKRVLKRLPKRALNAAQKKKVVKKQVSKVLSALENLRPKNAGPGRLKKLTSNIAAVRVPGGTSGSFKVAGVISKIPGGGVRLAGGIGGGGGKDTRVGSQLLSGAGSKIGRIAAAAGTGGRVRGRVRRAPKRAIRASGGILDRGAIQKVVNAHMSQIQRCYESQLLRNPGLAGKIVFDWVISTSGTVSSARQVRSSMRSPAVATCILAQIRTWRFPKPVGGNVNVRYPFVFRIQGF